MKALYISLLLLSGIIYSSNAQSDQKLVGTTDNLSESLISPGSLYAFYRFSYAGSMPEKFTEIHIEKSDSSYFLITKGEKYEKIYAFALKQDGVNLYMTKVNPVHTCSEGTPELKAFTFKDGILTGCKSGNYKKVE